MPNFQAYPFNILIKSFSNTFVNYMLDYERFSKNYKLLMANLPVEEQHFLLNIFTRVLFTVHGQIFTANNFTEEEIKQQQQIKELINGEAIDGHFKYQDYLLPVNHFESSTFYFLQGLESIKNKLKIQSKDIIDAGAYIGDSALILNKLTPSKIWAFEPVSQSYNFLLETIKLNQLKDIVAPVKYGLGDIKKEITIYVQNSGSTTTPTQNQTKFPTETIKITTIDDFVKENKLNVGLIKIDTEGTELEILRGAENTIRKEKPVLMVSIYHNAEEFFEVKPLIESWNLGYKFHFGKFNPYSFLFETMVICEVD